MKKILLSIAGVSLSVIALASCGKKNNEDNGNGTNTIADSYKLKIVCPSGAPIIGIAETVSYFNNNVEKENIGVLPNTLQGFFLAGEADIIIAPLNLGTKLYNGLPNGSKSDYQIAGILTWGNTYFASANSSFDINNINGNKLTTFGAGSITEATANYVLAQNNLVPSETETLGNAKLTAEKLKNDNNAIVMTAEPELAAVKQAKPNLVAYSVNDMYKQLTGLDMPQAAVFVDPDVVKDHKELLDAFLSKLDENDKRCETNPRDVAVKAIALGYGIEGEEDILAAGIPNSKVNYKKAKDSKAEINKMIELFTSYFTKEPADTFYYQ